jgi:F-type H+-transporting ATPase subunit delta
MSQQVVQSYANAFYEMANESGKTNRFMEEIESLAPIFKDAEVGQFFKSPLFTNQEKESAIETSVGPSVDADLLDFLKLLARNGRIGFLSQIVEEFKENCSGGKGIKKGEVLSATELSPAEKQGLQEAIEKTLNLKVNLDFKVSKELLGGIEARVAGYIIEDSLKSNLKKLNESLKRSSN